MGIKRALELLSNMAVTGALFWLLEQVEGGSAYAQRELPQHLLT